MAAVGTDLLEAPKQRRRRRLLLIRGSGDSDLAGQTMLRPLFAEAGPLDEVLASVRAESAGITSRSGRLPAVAIAAAAAAMIILVCVILFIVVIG